LDFSPVLANTACFLLLHKVEENKMKFFKVISEKITGGTASEFSANLTI
jgi:hypothetical protein